MAAAIVKGAIRSGFVREEAVLAVGRSDKGREDFFEMTGVQAEKNLEVLADAEVFLLAVKPGDALRTLESVQSFVKDRLIISVAAGVSLAAMEGAAPGARVVRTMPNTPCSIAEGVVAFSPGLPVTDADLAVVKALFQPLGLLFAVKEEQMHAVTALSGSGPAYFFLVIEAMADAGVRQGLPRELALKMAVQTAAGAALLARSEGGHPATLRDRVTSPGGTTIAAIEALEKNGLRFALFEAVEAAAARSRELAGESK